MEVNSCSWLITGGCGFLGTSLIAHLRSIAPDICIRIVDNLSVGTRQDLGEIVPYREVTTHEIMDRPQGIELFVSDIRNTEDCIRASTGVDIIVHFAANTGVAPSVENPRSDMEANVLGTFNMLDAARMQGVSRFIFASSGAPLGEATPPIHEKIAPKPVSPYGASKLAGEAYCSAFYRTYGLKTVSLRFGNVYGPRSKHKNSVIAQFFRRALAAQPLEIYGNGKQTRDFIYIHDLLQAILKAAKVEHCGESFQIATFRETTINELAEAIRVIVEPALNRPLEILYENPRTGDVMRNYSDISKARELLGFEPQYDLAKGLHETWQYFLALERAS